MASKSGEFGTNNMGGITLLGLGPGDQSLITRAAWDWLMQIETLYLRTKHHPTVDNLPEHIQVISFDDVYDAHESIAAVYEEIVSTIIALGKQPDGVTYAVPGHPFIAESTCTEIRKRATTEQIPFKVYEGLSFLEPTCTALGIDPLPKLILADALTISMHKTPGINPAAPLLIAQIYSRAVASNVKLTLMAVYPDKQPVRLVHGAGTSQEIVEELFLHELDKSQHLGYLSSLFVSPLSPNASFESFQEIIARLRAPDGCPWDREQTHLSLRPFLLEEAYETLDALDRQDMTDLQEELGDLLLQILLHAQIATEEGDFNIHDVINGIGTKLVRRHPHVFSSTEVEGVSGVIRNWEAIKAEERKNNGETSKKGLLDGVPLALPALLQAEEIIERVRRVEFDRLEKTADLTLIHQILEEIDTDREALTAEKLGLLLLAVVGLAHKKELNAESALREALTRFRLHFNAMEARALLAGVSLVSLSLEEKERLWVESEGDSGKGDSIK